jgi:hypothetical protein
VGVVGEAEEEEFEEEALREIEGMEIEELEEEALREIEGMEIEELDEEGFCRGETTKRRS